jgi:hypothetical protein
MDTKNNHETNFQTLNEVEGNLLVRIDERTKFLVDKVQSMEKKLENHYVTQEEFKQVKDEYVSQSDFWPVKTIAYGFVGLILIAVVGALLTLIVK